MVLDPIPQSLPVHFFGSRPQPPTSLCKGRVYMRTMYVSKCAHRDICVHVSVCKACVYMRGECLYMLNERADQCVCMYACMCLYICAHMSVSVCNCLRMYQRDIGWLRLVGSLESQLSFAEYCLFYRALLQKSHIIWVPRPQFNHWTKRAVGTQLMTQDSRDFSCYWVATISRLLRIIGLFCRIQSFSQGSCAQETYNLKEPTSRSYPIYPYTMGWLRSVGSIKSQVSCAEYRLFHRALLQKRPIMVRSLPIEATT